MAEITMPSVISQQFREPFFSLSPASERPKATCDLQQWKQNGSAVQRLGMSRPHNQKIQSGLMLQIIDP